MKLSTFEGACVARWALVCPGRLNTNNWARVPIHSCRPRKEAPVLLNSETTNKAHNLRMKGRSIKCANVRAPSMNAHHCRTFAILHWKSVQFKPNHLIDRKWSNLNTVDFCFIHLLLSIQFSVLSALIETMWNVMTFTVQAERNGYKTAKCARDSNLNNML